MVLPAEATQALTFSTEAGERATLEELIVKFERKELMDVPILRTLIEVQRAGQQARVGAGARAKETARERK